MRQQPRVFISYSHDSPAHKERVLELTERLRADGIDAVVDQYIETTGPPEGWPRWMEEQLRTADFVLLVCTSTYRLRVEARDDPTRGHGVLWESGIIYQYIYDAGVRNDRFVPILVDDETIDAIPMPLRGVLHYRPTDEAGYEDLYRRLSGQPRVQKRDLGSLRPLPPRKISPFTKKHHIDRDQVLLPGPQGVGARMVSRPALLLGVFCSLGAVIALGAWLLGSPNHTAYRVHITVRDPYGRAVDRAEITSSVAGELVQIGPTWELRIPTDSRPPGRFLILRANALPVRQSGETNVQLAGTSDITASISLHPDTSAMVRGLVIDLAQHPLAGVKVSIVGEQGSILTRGDGTFVLPAKFSEGQEVQLRAEKLGRPVVTQWHPAGDEPATIVVE